MLAKLATLLSGDIQPFVFCGDPECRCNEIIKCSPDNLGQGGVCRCEKI
ncbi:hypothetical protein ACFVR1_08505 [Psychrobacillus sp. NPDC058041]